MFYLYHASRRNEKHFKTTINSKMERNVVFYKWFIYYFLPRNKQIVNHFHFYSLKVFFFLFYSLFLPLATIRQKIQRLRCEFLHFLSVFYTFFIYNQYINAQFVNNDIGEGLVSMEFVICCWLLARWVGDNTMLRYFGLRGVIFKLVYLLLQISPVFFTGDLLIIKIL